MNYTKIYNKIIFKRRDYPAVGYVERHHILPRCLGGTDEAENLVNVTAREHFICHLLLTRMYEHDIVKHRKMIKSFFMMLVCKSGNQERYISSRQYAKLREQFSKAKSEEQSGSGNSQFGKKSHWVWHEMFGKRRIDRNLLEEYTSQGWFFGLRHNFVRSPKIKDTAKQVEKFTAWYELYSKVGFDEFRKLTDYPYSKQNLVQQFAKFVKSFIPQNGKRRNLP